ncbi:DUF3293 domain-containing protein [Paraconexibacter sp.]|uniref:DUF3293 domain-containing protein n=1 Tax=Paraconexibacter sp. TaxID=2949640 RepID=UPI0035620946
MRLYLDDTRPAPDGWTLARTAREAIAVLQRTPVDELSLDYDLPGEDGTAVTAWMTRERVWPLVSVSVHSSNPRGALALSEAIEQSRLFSAPPGDLRRFVRPGIGTDGAPNGPFAWYGEATLEFDGYCGPVRDAPGRPDGQAVCVITAHNPGSAVIDADENAHANERLRARLEHLGAVAEEAGGGAADGSHWEESFAVRDVPVEAVRLLGRDFGQRAIFVADRHGITIRDCRPLWFQDGREKLHVKDVCESPSAARAVAEALSDHRRGELSEDQTDAVITANCPGLDPLWVRRLPPHVLLVP